MGRGCLSFIFILFFLSLQSCFEKAPQPAEAPSNAGSELTKQAECRVLDQKLSTWTSSDRISIHFQCSSSADYVVSKLQCRLGGVDGLWKDCTDRSLHKVDGLSNGQQVFEVKAEYTNGEVALSVPYIWKVDTFAPSILNVERTFDEKKGELVFDVDAIDSGGSGVEEYECELTPVSSWETCSARSVFKVLDEAQAYVFKARVKDKAGNSSPVFIDESFQALRVPSSYNTGVECGFTKDIHKALRERTFTVSFECKENGKALSQLECKVDDGEWGACLSERHHRLEKLNLGKHSFEVRKLGEVKESDEEDLAQAPLRWDFIVDDLAPLTVITHAEVESLTPSFSFEVRDNLSDFVKSECQLESSGRVIRDWHPCQSPFTVSTGLQEGLGYQLKIRGIDQAGNIGKIESRSWKAVRQTKAVCLILNQGRKVSLNEEQLKVDFYCHGPSEVKSFECRVNHGAWRGCASNRFDILEHGEDIRVESFQVRAQDESGQWGNPSLPYHP
ncbi:hypothetical protein GW915_07460 [bacterium]|nr:hypothetical protein [bacterium]